MSAPPAQPEPPSASPMRALQDWARTVSTTVSSLGSDEHTQLLILAVAIGAAAGLAVLLFYAAIDLIQGLVLRTALRIPVPAALLIPAFVALGLIACRSLVRWGAKGSSGENIPDVMYRVTVKAGVIPTVPVFAKSLGAAIVIGTGGSVGAEGPVAVLGAATGSRIGRWLRASPNRLRTLVGCGAAAGISAAFNAPIAGVIFGVEKILGAAGGMALGPFVVASIIAATVSRAAFGNHPVMTLPTEFNVGSAWEFLTYAGLGVLTGLVSVLYSRGVWKAQDRFAAFPRPWVQVALGALIIGGLDLVFRADLWGHGHESIDLEMFATRSALFLLALGGAKLVATAVSFGAGGVGGVFTPALFIGAAVGGSFGAALSDFLPGMELIPGATALVGMAGLVAGSTHAPLTAIMMVFEMTGDYGLILPLMLTSVVAYGIARRLHPESIYTEWLVRRGVVLTEGADAAVLSRHPVHECMNRRPAVIPETASLRQIVDLTAGSRQTEFPVLDAEGRLAGMLTQAGIREALANGDDLKTILLAADLVVPERHPLTSDDTLLTALRRLGGREANLLPVVSPDDRQRLEGTVSRQDVMAAYERALTQEGH